jgi:hypothetical protein
MISKIGFGAVIHKKDVNSFDASAEQDAVMIKQMGLKWFSGSVQDFVGAGLGVAEPGRLFVAVAKVFAKNDANIVKF